MNALTRKERDALMRERVWLLIGGVAHEGVVLWRRLGLVRVLYWPTSLRQCSVILLRPSADVLIPRDAP